MYGNKQKWVKIDISIKKNIQIIVLINSQNKKNNNPYKPTYNKNKPQPHTIFILNKIMSKKPVYLLYSQLNNLKPKLLKYKTYVNKLITQNPLYKFKEYQSEGIAKNLLEVYQVEYKKYLINLKKEKFDQKVPDSVKQMQKNVASSITGIRTDIQSDISQQKVNQKNNSEHIPHKPKPHHFTHTKEQQGILKPKTLQQLIHQKQSLLDLTPSMPSLLQNFTPTPIIQPFGKNSIFTGYFDGCSKFNPGPASVGYYMTHGENLVFEACWALGRKTNNQAEFSALLFLLTNAYINGIRRVRLFGDSRLIVELVNGKMKTSHINIVDYYNSVYKMINRFNYWKLEFIERHYNTRADKLSNMALKASKKKPESNKTQSDRKKESLKKQLKLYKNELSDL